MSKIQCLFHQDDTASLEVYEDGFHCFGCAKSGTLEELMAAGASGITVTPKDPPEDITASIQRISKLPTKSIRGLTLPYDEFGYYIIWPKNEYYKKRLWEPKPKQSKYYCPRGNKQPLLFLRQPKDVDTLIFVEGEINALSLYQSVTTADVCSPGGASQFTKDHLTVMRDYANILIMVDNDKAGIMAYIEIQSQLAANGILANRVLMQEDANDILVKYGQEKLRETVANARR